MLQFFWQRLALPQGRGWRCWCSLLCLCLLVACAKPYPSHSLPSDESFTFKIYDWEKQTFKLGLASRSGKLLIPPIYDRLQPFKFGVAFFENADGWGMLGEQGQVLYFSVFKQNLYGGPHGANDIFPVQENGRYGFLRLDGTWAIPPQYEDAWFFAQGLAPVKINGLWGFINDQGKVVIAPAYDRTYGFDDASYASTNLGYVVVNERCGYIDTSGDMVIPPTFQSVGNFGHADNTVYMMDWRYGILAKDGQILVPPIYERLQRLKHGLYAASMRPKFLPDPDWGIIRSNGEAVTDFIYDYLGYMDDEGLIPVGLKGKRGILRADGTMLIEPQYDSIWDFSGKNLTPVTMGKQCGYVNRQGQLRIEGLDECWGFSKAGLARVKRNGLWEYINEQGTTVLATPYAELSWSTGSTLVADGPDGLYILDEDSGALLLSVRHENGVQVARNSRGEQIWPVSSH